MRAFSFCGLIALAGSLFLWETGGGAPVQSVEPADIDLLPFATHVVQHELKGQEETRIIASGRAPYYLGLYVFDRDGNCVAWDDFGGTEVREDCGVIFTPPTQGIYRIEVRSFFHLANKVRFVVR